MQLDVTPAADGVSTLAVSGEVDLSTAAQLRAAGIAAVAAPECTALTLDLAAVQFLDSSGVGALVAIRAAGVERARPVTVANPSRRARQVLEICGLATEFGLVPSPSVPVGE